MATGPVPTLGQRATASVRDFGQTIARPPLWQEDQNGANSGGARACRLGLPAGATYVNLLRFIIILFVTLSLSPLNGGVARTALVMLCGTSARGRIAQRESYSLLITCAKSDLI